MSAKQDKTKKNTVLKPAKSGKKKPLIKTRLSPARLLILVAILVGLAGVIYRQYLHNNDQLIIAFLPQPPADAIYKQANQPIDARINDLLQRMTLEEKIGQMSLVDKNSVHIISDISYYTLGGLLSGAGAKPQINTPEGWLKMITTFKQQAMKSRLGIPLLYGIDATHGDANVPGATVFPHDIGLGATHDPELVKAVATATAEELAATGVNWNFAPSLDAPEDIRWGRTYEAFSSSPTLNAQLGAAYIEGIQAPTATAQGSKNVLATAKHFLAAGTMQWLTSSNKKFKIDQGKSAPRDDLLDSEYLVPYAAASKVGVGSVMVGLNHWGNGRVIDNKYLITDKLKTQLGYKGFVVSDWYGMYEFSGTSAYNANIHTINAGVDMAMLPFEYKGFIKDVRSAVKKGYIPESRIDDAVQRILYQKFKAGLFDTMEPTTLSTSFGTTEHRQLARRAVAASAVLLKNDNNLLPLSTNTAHMLVAGSGADNIGRQSGAWTVEWQGIDGNWLPGATSILKGIKSAVGANTVVEYNKEANFLSQTEKADVGIVIISEKPYAEGFGDSALPSLEPSDALAIQRMHNLAKKVVIVSVSGRPLLISSQIATSNAMVAAWLPGSEGEGVADVLFGTQVFSGTLPIDWPASISQVPISVHSRTADGKPPLFSRGFSL